MGGEGFRRAGEAGEERQMTREGSCFASSVNGTLEAFDRRGRR